MEDQENNQNDETLDGNNKQPVNPEDPLPPEDDTEPKPDPNEEKNKVLQIIKQGLSQMGKTFDNSGYALINLKVEEKELTTIYDILWSYPHLRYVNFSNNNIISLP